VSLHLFQDLATIAALAAGIVASILLPRVATRPDHR
jgi:hypothetical protein